MNKKRNRLYGIIEIIVAAACGFFVTYGLLTIQGDMELPVGVFYDYDMIFALIALISLVLTLWNTIGLQQIRHSLTNTGITREDTYTNKAKDSDEDVMIEEDMFSPQENAIGKLIPISAYNSIITLVWLALAIAYFGGAKQSSTNEETFMLINTGLALAFVVLATIMHYFTIHVFNKVYPNRTLDLGAPKGEHEFFEKLDEGEKWIVYRSAYRAFRIVNVLMVGGIFFFTGYSLMFTFTPLPILVLAVIWVTQNMVYMRETNKFYTLTK